MIRRFNYTQRVRIIPADAAITLDDSTEPISFNVRFALTQYNLQATAGVFIEAYRGNSFMRFACGTVANIQLPENRQLTEIEGADFARFRVKVVDTDTMKLVATTPTFRPAHGGGSDDNETKQVETLLHSKTTDLNNGIWKLKFSDEVITLLLNERIDDISRMAETKHTFRSVIFPQIVREILTRMIFVEQYTVSEKDEDEDDTVWANWLQFIRDCGMPEEYPGPWRENSEPQDLLEWIETAVDCFCARYKIMAVYRDATRKGSRK